MLIPNLGETEIFEPIYQGMANAPEAGSYALLWGHAKAEAAPEQQALELCRQYIERKVSGVFFAPLEWVPEKDQVNAAICALFDAARIPVVLLVCANDHTASLLLQALQEAGLRVPQDVRVVGIDDVDYARLPAHRSQVEC